MDTSDWRNQLQSETRQLTFNQILDTIRTHHFVRDEEGFLELQKIARSVEEKTYAGATSEADYFHKIGLKILSVRDASDWRAQLQPESRQRIVNKIADTLIRHLGVSGAVGLQEMWKIAQRFEEKIFSAATSQSDYLRKISLKMLALETKSHRQHGQTSNQFGTHNEPANPVDTNLRKQSNRSKRRPTWTRDYHMVNLNLMDINNGSQGTEAKMDATDDWRGQLLPESRQRIVDNMQEGLHELRKIVQRFEEKTLTAATSQSDYLQKISLKMRGSHGTMANDIPSNQVDPSNIPPDPYLVMQPQVHNLLLPNQPQSQPNLPPESNVGQNFNMQNITGQNSEGSTIDDADEPEEAEQQKQEKAHDYRIVG